MQQNPESTAVNTEQALCGMRALYNIQSAQNANFQAFHLGLKQRKIPLKAGEGALRLPQKIILVAVYSLSTTSNPNAQ